MTFIHKLDLVTKKTNSLLCVGLDPHFDKLPERFASEKYPQFAFNQWIMEQTHEFVSVFKPQFAHYEARGSRGWHELEMTVEHAREHYPNHVLIADAKRADIGSSNEEYATAMFDHLGFDAITLHPYLGQEALEPFLARKDKGCIILCRTSNPGAGELQDLGVRFQVSGEDSPSTIGKQTVSRSAQDDTARIESLLTVSSEITLWEHVAWKVSQEWNQNNNCLLVVGATYPEELKRVREIVGDMTLLVPGIGAQGGDLERVMQWGLNAQKKGLIIHASRSIIFSNNPREEAKKLRDDINRLR